MTEKDTLAQWLYNRYVEYETPWNCLPGNVKSYWEHEANAVRRAVARGGFK